VGKRAFSSWRGLPTDFAPTVRQRLLEVWHRAGRPRPEGGLKFRLIAAIIGPYFAARLFHTLVPQPYSTCRTLENETLAKQIEKLPPSCL